MPINYIQCEIRIIHFGENHPRELPELREPRKTTLEVCWLPEPLARKGKEFRFEDRPILYARVEEVYKHTKRTQEDMESHRAAWKIWYDVLKDH